MCWGLMAPLGKDALLHGISGITLVSSRVLGGAILFWIASLFAPRERVAKRDKLLFVGAAVFGLVCNPVLLHHRAQPHQPRKCRYRDYDDADLCPHPLGTDPQGAITRKKALGVALGCCGALLLIWTSMQASGSSLQLGDIRGDLLCVAGQVSYALYLTIFGKLAKKYSVFTVNKWMFLWATLLLLPFTASEALQTDVASPLGHAPSWRSAT